MSVELLLTRPHIVACRCVDALFRHVNDKRASDPATGPLPAVEFRVEYEKLFSSYESVPGLILA